MLMAFELSPITPSVFKIVLNTATIPRVVIILNHQSWKHKNTNKLLNPRVRDYE